MSTYTFMMWFQQNISFLSHTGSEMLRDVCDSICQWIIRLKNSGVHRFNWRNQKNIKNEAQRQKFTCVNTNVHVCVTNKELKNKKRKRHLWIAENDGDVKRHTHMKSPRNGKIVECPERYSIKQYTHWWGKKKDETKLKMVQKKT